MCWRERRLCFEDIVEEVETVRWWRAMTNAYTIYPECRHARGERPLYAVYPERRGTGETMELKLIYIL